MGSFDDVRTFHKEMGLKVGEGRPVVLAGADWERRVRLILEELAELARAQASKDLPEFADGLVDLVWVVLGTAVEAGMPWDVLWQEVKRSNMAKLGGKLDASGKLLKPEGWTPPDIRGVLELYHDGGICRCPPGAHGEVPWGDSTSRFGCLSCPEWTCGWSPEEVAANRGAHDAGAPPDGVCGACGLLSCTHGGSDHERKA